MNDYGMSLVPTDFYDVFIAYLESLSCFGSFEVPGTRLVVVPWDPAPQGRPK